MSEDFALESSTLQFSLDRDRASWSLFDRQVDGVSLVDARMRVAYRLGGRRFEALKHLAARRNCWTSGDFLGTRAPKANYSVVRSG